MSIEPSPASGPAPSKVVTKATLRAADRLQLKNRTLGKIIGLSGPTVSRMYSGSYSLQAGSKPYELAVLFIRFYRSLDAIIGGDDNVAADWINNQNTVLGGKPVDLIQSISGLSNVIEYLDARRAVV